MNTASSNCELQQLVVQEELESRSDERDRLHRHEFERARYEADLARRRYMQVDPGIDWSRTRSRRNGTTRYALSPKLRIATKKQRKADHAGLDDKQRANVMTLARDFPRLWNDPRTRYRERKRMARLFIADVTLLKGADVCVQIRFNGGATHMLHVPLSRPAWILRQTPRAVIAEKDRLLNEYTEGETAEKLNGQGLISGSGKRFNSRMITRIRLSYELPSHHDRLRARGMLTLDEIAQRLNVMPSTVKSWRRAGLLVAHR
ncbi:hypothetical protein [Paraburkholderia aspalathi]|uniref:hypothetical protein n=1 Tax=Paraburkholderia aspalathi TaxID=1324617 RepID=UPI0038B8DC46